MNSGQAVDPATACWCTHRTQAERAGPNQGNRAVGVSDRCPNGAKPRRGFDAQHESTPGHGPGTQTLKS